MARLSCRACGAELPRAARYGDSCRGCGTTIVSKPEEPGSQAQGNGADASAQEAPQAPQEPQGETIPPTLGADQPPPIAMARYAIHFSTPGKSSTIPLEGLIETKNASGLLLYGLILKIHDLDVTLRRVLHAGAEARQGQPSPAELVKETLEGFAKSGLFPGGKVPGS